MSSKLIKFNGGKITVNSIPKMIELVEPSGRALLLQGAPGIGRQ